MKDLQLTLSTEEINLILEGLGNLPFIRVYQLIGKLQEQAGQQLSRQNGHEQEQAIAFPQPDPAKS
jgi:hypothetical protein